MSGEVYCIRSFALVIPHRLLHRRVTRFRSLPPSSSTSIASDGARIPPNPLPRVLLVRLRPAGTEVCGEGVPWNSEGDESNIIMTACRRLAPVAIASLLSRLALLTVKCEPISVRDSVGRGWRAVGGDSLRDFRWCG
jgi:hypothetical protein